MKKKTFVYPFILAIFIITLFPVTVHADSGPKPQLTIYVKNAPDELYYLDLLTQKTDNRYDNFNENERKNLNQDMIKLLYSYKKENWKPALVEGTGAPMWGDLIGKTGINKKVHTFGYAGVPDTYKIIIVTKSGEVSVSDTLTRKVLQGSVTYDYKTKKVTTPNIAVAYICQFLLTCISTLIIEGIILLAFNFSLKENWKVFLIVNIITQIFLTATLGMNLLKKGTTSAFFIQFPIEIVILIVEAIIYGKFLKGQSRKRCVAYGIVANLLSFGLGLVLLHFQYLILSKLM